ncbi:MAG: hypothetical protein UT03_C0037G0003 [Candidatus Moranbacteria bacterium GW2011_GWD2_38_7]|nr:MAG: hypothetical protein UT03_C0037G0003 [Candidatus Moranbacteria bacterium GW2011_GWD2_38_7]
MKKSIWAVVVIVILILSFRFYKTTISLQPKDNWVNVLDICQRNTPYQLPPEFSRSVSLILQRYQDGNDENLSTYRSIENCLDIQYGDLDEEEGLFYFDPKYSSTDHLTIRVDSDYKYQDDLTTAFLLSHELTHAKQFVKEIVSGKKMDCVDMEAEAFFQQIKFGSYLNDEESKSVVARAEKVSNKNSQIINYSNLLDIGWDAIGGCNLHGVKVISNEQKNCYKNLLSEKLREMVRSNTYYQKQCYF